MEKVDGFQTFCLIFFFFRIMALVIFLINHIMGILSGLFSPYGTRSRIEYIITTIIIAFLPIPLVVLFGSMISAVMQGSSTDSSPYTLYGMLGVIGTIMFWICLCNNAKRLHDLGHSGWWQILFPVPALILYGLYLSNTISHDALMSWGKVIASIPYWYLLLFAGDGMSPYED